MSKNITPVLNDVLRSATICINAFKLNAKCERLFRQFCEDENEDSVRLSHQAEVRLLSNGNCLKRFMDLCDVLSDFLGDKPEMMHLVTVESKAYVSYLTDIIFNLNMPSKQLQRSNKALVDVNTKTFSSLHLLRHVRKNISHKNFD